MIHQELAPLPDMTIADNIFLGQEIMNGKFLNDHEMIESDQRYSTGIWNGFRS